MEEKKTAGAQIKEIAERLGVSQSTVSVVLGGRGDRIRISKETQKKVRDMAREMNYRPNIYARRLRHAEEEVPYVVVVFWRIDSLNSRVGRFIRGLYEASEKRECRVELMIQPYKPGELMCHADMLSSNRVSGAIISGLSTEDQTELEKQEYSIPIVLIERESTKFHCITMDTYRTGEQCIAYMSAPDGSRLHGLRSADGRRCSARAPPRGSCSSSSNACQILIPDHRSDIYTVLFLLPFYPSRRQWPCPVSLPASSPKQIRTHRTILALMAAKVHTLIFCHESVSPYILSGA